ncbi:TPA_asm: hypothetical protein [Metorhabdovirus 1]|nr:TPA_asm: hypothetical protein [Metorhabdovirus 1]
MSEKIINQKLTQLKKMNLRDPTPVPSEILQLDNDGEPTITLPPPPSGQDTEIPNPGVFFTTHLGSNQPSVDTTSVASSSDISSVAYHGMIGGSLIPATACGVVSLPYQDRRQLVGVLRSELDKCLPNPMPGKTDFIEKFCNAWFSDDVSTMAASIRDVVYRVHTSEARRGRSSSRPVKPPLSSFEEYAQKCNEGSTVVLTKAWISSIYDACPGGLISKLMTIAPSQRFSKMFRRRPKTRQDIYLMVSSYVNGET